MIVNGTEISSSRKSPQAILAINTFGTILISLLSTIIHTRVPLPTSPITPNTSKSIILIYVSTVYVTPIPPSSPGAKVGELVQMAGEVILPAFELLMQSIIVCNVVVPLGHTYFWIFSSNDIVYIPMCVSSQATDDSDILWSEMKQIVSKFNRPKQII